MTELTQAQLENRKVIETIWREVYGMDGAVELCISPNDWTFYERLLNRSSPTLLRRWNALHFAALSLLQLTEDRDDEQSTSDTA